MIIDKNKVIFWDYNINKTGKTYYTLLFFDKHIKKPWETVQGEENFIKLHKEVDNSHWMGVYPWKDNDFVDIVRFIEEANEALFPKKNNVDNIKKTK